MKDIVSADIPKFVETVRLVPENFAVMIVTAPCFGERLQSGAARGIWLSVVFARALRLRFIAPSKAADIMRAKSLQDKLTPWREP